MARSTRALVLMFACCCAGTVTAAEQQVLAVFTLEERGTGLDAAEVELLSDTLSEAIERRGRYKVVAPRALRRALKDAMKGKFKECFDRICQIALGREVKAELVLSGKLSKIGPTCLVNVQIWTLKDGVSIRAAAAKGACSRDRLIQEMDRISARLTAPLEPRPARPSNGEPAPQRTAVDEVKGPPPWRPPAKKWIRVPAGEFVMGTKNQNRDWPEHKVTISRDFLLKTTEVTQAEWVSRMGSLSPSQHKRCGNQCPVERVSWWDAVAYCNASSEAEGLPKCYRLKGCEGAFGSGFSCKGVRFAGLDCQGYRLPTEAEWEYAARNGTDPPVARALNAIAWYGGNSEDKPHRVAEKQPTLLGLYDMVGNVNEWTHDRWGKTSARAAKDPTGPSRDARRVIRGCGFDSSQVSCRITRRGNGGPSSRDGSLGFRPARTLVPGKTDE